MTVKAVTKEAKESHKRHQARRQSVKRRQSVMVMDDWRPTESSTTILGIGGSVASLAAAFVAVIMSIQILSVGRVEGADHGVQG